ncbi:hypothetical protein [Tengunoibacter tsumagoiensis]|uniref:hypothetical protein n=1 Tax=Tengunoibacter tsumagoiensis TaxID=2014871 RepID=UPI000F819C57|nr:hypothetical protein [Tengunoibacter tsumagoiensis]
MQTPRPLTIELYQLASARFCGGLLSFLFGVCVPSWILAWLQWGWRSFPWWLHVNTAPVFWSYLQHPHILSGLVWLLYYYLAYYWSIGRPKQENSRRPQETRYEYSSGSRIISSTPPSTSKTPLAAAWEGEQKDLLIEKCYQHYRKALRRYDPPLIHLKTPRSFYYGKGVALAWRHGTDLILPEEYLTPERIEALLPFLAHHLAAYNTDEPDWTELDEYPGPLPFPLFLALTGNFLWLVTVRKQAILNTERIDTQRIKTVKIHKADEFAVYLGQGPALEHQLRRMLAEIQRDHQVDQSIPPLIERIGHLEALNRREQEEVAKLASQQK